MCVHVLKAGLCAVTEAALVYLWRAASQSGSSSRRRRLSFAAAASLIGIQVGLRSETATEAPLPKQVAASLCLSGDPGGLGACWRKKKKKKEVANWDETTSEILRLVPSGGTTWEAGNRQEVSRLVTVPVSADAGKKNKKTFAAFDSVADVHVEGNQVTPRRVCPLAVTMGFVFLCFHGRVDVGASLHFPSSFTENIGLKKKKALVTSLRNVTKFTLPSCFWRMSRRPWCHC